jgi:hypothetical protein
LKLLKFAAQPSKFTTKWTQGLDGLAAADVAQYLTLLEVEEEGLVLPHLVQGQQQAEEPAERELTLTLCHPQKGKKVVKCSSHISEKELTKLCKKKLGGGKFCKGVFLDHDKANLITDSAIKHLNTGDSLYTS